MSTAETFDNTSSIFDIGSWTVSHFKTAVNLTHYAPSAKDLLLAGPRIGMKVGSFIFALPEAFDDVIGGRIGQRVISEATGTNNIAPPITTAQLAREMAQARPDILVDMQDHGGGIGSRLLMESGRNFGNIFQYATSRWSLACIIMAIVLNRTHIYASSRRNLTLGFKVRLALRIIPIVLFAFQARWLLQSIQCQTSPDFGLLRWGNASKTVDLMFTQNGGPLHTISSALLLGASDAESCRNVKMVPPEYDTPGTGPPDLSGSLSLLWPLFETLCFSQFVETISCAVQGRQVAAETGMTLFEHSLAFAESDAAVSSSLGLGPFSGPGSATFGSGNSTSLPELAIKRSMIMGRVNTPPEVLLVGFLSSMNHITSHILAIFNMQGRLRLISTAFWGLSFMSIITWSILNFSIDDNASQGLLRFPTVCIIGFIPHVLVLAGIILCSIIYGIALVLTALALPGGLQPAPRSFLQRLALAHENMQANVPLSNIRISMHMDFYTALLKTGFSALTMASEAVYLNESPEVNIKPRTWLEDDRLREIEETGAHWLGPNFRASGLDSVTDGVGLVAKDPSRDLQGDSTSGYGRERTAQKSGSLNASTRNRVIRDGVGATERSGRWIMAFEFFLGIFKLMIHWWGILLLKILGHFGVRSRPRWLMRLVKRPKNIVADTAKRRRDPETLDFWLIGNDGELVLPASENVDVEAEMRKRLKEDRTLWSDADEKNLESNLYSWWLNGGWWGGDDNSGTFQPQDVDDDTTSVISMFSENSELDCEPEDSNDEHDGRRTPTQESFGASREATPVVDTPLSSADLAQLLNPVTPEQRAEARALAVHLGSNSIMTRSRYRDALQRDRAKVLTSTHRRPDHLRNSIKLTPEEEAQILEHLIISRRSSHNTPSQRASSSSWAEGASGLGDGGPQCVVCQSAPRSIIVWPCRCLSLCDDCRVTLAMNNFDKCVCCRRDVGSFSRIFVP